MSPKRTRIAQRGKEMGAAAASVAVAGAQLNPDSKLRRKVPRSRARSRADAYRCSLHLRRHFRRIRSSSGGLTRLYCPIGGASSLRMLAMVDDEDCPKKGLCPFTIS